VELCGGFVRRKRSWFVLWEAETELKKRNCSSLILTWKLRRASDDDDLEVFAKKPVNNNVKVTTIKLLNRS